MLRLSKRAFVAVDTTISTRPLTRESVKDKGITARNICIPRIWTRSSRCTVRKAAQSQLRHPLHKLKMLTAWTRLSSFASLRTSSTQFHKYCQAVYENLLKISTWLASTAKCLASPRSTILFSRELIGLANDPQNVYPPTPPRVVFVLIMRSIAGGDSPLSVTGSIVGIVALLISFPTIIRALDGNAPRVLQRSPGIG